MHTHVRHCYFGRIVGDALLVHAAKTAAALTARSCKDCLARMPVYRSARWLNKAASCGRPKLRPPPVGNSKSLLLLSDAEIHAHTAHLALAH